MSEIELKARELLGEQLGPLEVGAIMSGAGDLFVAESAAVKAIIAALAPQWQPIESAPKDGTRLMLWDSRAGGYAVTGAWVAGSADDHETITHWQPLPAAPEVEG
ncbi:DUF551 domain-containing protein [Stenotrophomonas hibiscicola]|uniref:DUF551 domain-containing protein n=1 Tax=Stenotrophomonas hibiscicola TaxID=86189 RepID=UPI00037295AD|nr:DUF551 domain-containing protein [[Pseudomonas] hibiscicola]